jgi:predicted polyphosphate/ATP-dependent NAD kinase
MERRIGIIVNPDAGLGGRLALKGSDGMAKIARAKGAEDRAGPRMHEAFLHLNSIIELSSISWNGVHWFLPKGRMGDEWIPESMKRFGKWSNIFETPMSTAVYSLVEKNVEIILYAGGDGTTRDIIGALESIDSASTPILGIPAGVKMHSGSFGASPRSAAEAFAAWFSGNLLIAQTEVMDLDETLYREGEWVVRMYAEAMSPGSPRWMQGSKQRIERISEVEVLESMADHIREIIEEDPEILVIWGSGGTLRTLGESMGFTISVLGIDVSLGKKMIGTDLNEVDLLEIINQHKSTMNENAKMLTLLSPMGGQGFLIGRGNLQLSPAVLRSIGIDNIFALVTPAKLATLNTLRIDTGDISLDLEFQEKKYMKALQGYRTTRLIRISAE